MSNVKEIQAGVTAVVQAVAPQPHIDIINERRKATFSVEELSAHLNGGSDQLVKR